MPHSICSCRLCMTDTFATPIYVVVGVFIARVRMPAIKFKNETCRAILLYLLHFILHIWSALLLQKLFVYYILSCQQNTDRICMLQPYNVHATLAHISSTSFHKFWCNFFYLFCAIFQCD